MKLAEALIWRADAKKRMEQVKQRILNNAKVQEGDQPAEDPLSLLAEHEWLLADFTLMVQRINRTNSATPLRDGLSIADALALRDTLVLRVELLRDLAQEAVIGQVRYTKSEVKFRSTVEIAELQQQIDRLAAEHRELDTQIQGINWQIELLE